VHGLNGRHLEPLDGAVAHTADWQLAKGPWHVGLQCCGDAVRRVPRGVGLNEIAESIPLYGRSCTIHVGMVAGPPPGAGHKPFNAEPIRCNGERG